VGGGSFELLHSAGHNKSTKYSDFELGITRVNYEKPHSTLQIKLNVSVTTKTSSPVLVEKLAVVSAPELDVLDAPLAGDVAVEDELVPVTVVLVTMCVQLSLDGIEKLLLNVTSVH